ncbi:MAG TPA: hypothetical protein VF246_08290 [Acidimicrobiia bacterium]|jgi:hypothetical protein
MADASDSMGHNVTRGILFGIPVGLVLMTILFWAQGDMDLLGALGAALLPGTLFGVFGGGFAGVAISMSKEH